MSAAAGFGKTTLVAESLDGHPATAWLSLDPRDDDPQAFWSYVLAALETVRPGVGASARSLLDSSRPSFDAAVASLINDLDALDDEVVLVLDDYHVITSPEIRAAIALMAERLPPRARLVLISRADPPLPPARLRARGALAEVRAADLRFVADDALQLAALSMRGRDDVAGFVAGFSGDDRFVLDYLVGEVLERQREDVRDFLLRTSILGRLTGPLCDAVTGGGGGATLIDLERSNLFLVALDERRVWYRYHYLFGDVLQSRLRDERPARSPRSTGGRAPGGSVPATCPRPSGTPWPPATMTARARWWSARPPSCSGRGRRAR